MNLFDARLDKKYAKVRFFESSFDDAVEVIVSLPDSELTFWFNYHEFDITMDSFIKLLEISGYTVIRV